MSTPISLSMPGRIDDNKPESSPRQLEIRETRPSSPVKIPQKPAQLLQKPQLPPKKALDGFLDLRIAEYYDNKEDDDALWARYTDDFKAWNEEFFNAANRNKVVKLRTCLREHGVRVEMDRKKAKMGASLAQIMQEEEPAEWKAADIERFKRDNLTVFSK